MATRNVEWLDTSILDINEGQMEGLPKNPRSWTKDELAKLKKSLQETPELFEARPILAYDYDGRLLVLGGNMRLSAAKALGMAKVPVYVYPSSTPLEKLKEIVIKDNGAFGAWDWDMLANEWDALPLQEWGVPTWKVEQASEQDEDDEIERKRKEFEERMAAGENLEEDEEYQAFVDKFQQKKTTDDCYTPDVVYEALAKWVSEKYGVPRSSFVRPFYPNGDYKSEEYPKGCAVVDNPPFSILAEIIRFYVSKGIEFFLFAPALTLFSSSSSCTALGVGASITYANGANVSTSFVTNLEPYDVQFRSEPSLYKVIKEANDENLKELRKSFPKYVYPPHVVISPWLSILSRLGISFDVKRGQAVAISQLDAQKESGKAIYGKGWLLADSKITERERVERERVERWQLSDREKKIAASLG